MAGTAHIDRKLLHQYLWDNRTRTGTVHKTQTQLAEELGMSVWHLNRIFQQLTAVGALKNRRKQSRSPIIVCDPATVKWDTLPAIS